jgi:hypothetical protein
MLLKQSQMRQSFAGLVHAAQGGARAGGDSGLEGGASTGAGPGGADIFKDLQDQQPQRKVRARPNDGGATVEEEEARQARAMTLYLVGAKLAQRLLSLAAPFLAQLQDGAVADLEREPPAVPAPAKKNSNIAPQQQWQHRQRAVRERALDMLALLCEHSTIEPSTPGQKGRFDMLLDAILPQLDIDRHACEGESEQQREAYFAAFVEKSLSPAVVALARASAHDAAWQTLHSAVLEFTRHAAPAVRAATLSLIVQLFERAGEGYIVLVADTLPAVAELLEDQDKQVKLQAHKTARKLQQLSGEDLSSFLN